MRNEIALLVVRRSGEAVPFDAEKIRVAVANAVLKDEHGNPYNRGSTGLSGAQRELVDEVTNQVVSALLRRSATSVHIEDIQDKVELALMRVGEHRVARGYVLYREMRAKRREAEAPASAEVKAVLVIDANGESRALDLAELRVRIAAACEGVDHVNPDRIEDALMRDLFSGITEAALDRAFVLATVPLIEEAPEYDRVAARLFLHALRKEIFAREVPQAEAESAYREHFCAYLACGVKAGLLDERLLTFNVPVLAEALQPARDLAFGFQGLQTLYDRYLIHVEDKRIELPQYLFMRVAMGLALNERDRERRAMEFYEVLSKFDYMTSTPTLFNAGSRRPQLSSCYLTTVADDLASIFDAIKDNALLSKWAGGLGNDWTPVRALGAYIAGTNGKSQGVVPFLKVANDTSLAVNQGGRRLGALCSYLETWHLDIEEFLELRKNTGDDRRRTPNMNTANWIPDLFMRRVMENGDWMLFSPSDVPDLHDLYGLAFEQAYVAYEDRAARGELMLHKRMRAADLWRKMVTMLFETGHPWITFKDPCNIRSPQQHVGVVHSSNLCSEIALNTSSTEIAVCNLGSVNLRNHLVWDAAGRAVGLDYDKLARTVKTAIRMLDNVVDVNYYAVEKARASNLRHRPVGLGLMGWQDVLYAMRVPFDAPEAAELADESTEALCYFAYSASADLAEERGPYETFQGSLWSRGILPLDSLKLLTRERRGQYVEVNMTSRLDWDALRGRIQAVGMRNSNCVAIAPTATISNIVGVSASIEPMFQNLYAKSNLSGEFKVINDYLVADLRKLGVWDEVMANDIKHFDGSVQKIDRVPEELKRLYRTAFEIDPLSLVEAGSRRQKWIDQAQSLNIYMAGSSGKRLSDLYQLAWVRGLKTTYYLRTLGASSAEKSTGRGGELQAVPESATLEAKACPIDGSCESCQ